MEQDLGLIGGQHLPRRAQRGPAVPHAARRPGYADYRTPIKGLYHGSCATHGGGGVNGIPGWQAFNMAKKDKAVGQEVSRVTAAGGEPDERTALERMLEARSVAVVGASVKEGSLGHQMMVELLARRVRRRDLPGEPRLRRGPRASRATRRSPTCPSPSTSRSSASRTTASSRRCATRSRPARAPRSRSRRCYEAEPREPACRRSPSALAAIARDAGIALCGGNGMGFLNLESEPARDRVRDARRHPARAGDVHQPLGVGVRGARVQRPRASASTSIVSSGQEIVTDVADYMGYALGLAVHARDRAADRDGPRPGRRSARRSRTPPSADVPVIALKVGRDRALEGRW